MTTEPSSERCRLPGSVDRRSELYIGTLKKFIEAMDGELVLAARFPGSTN